MSLAVATRRRIGGMEILAIAAVGLVVLQPFLAGTFGKRFTYRFAPTTFVVAVVMATAFGWWLL